MNYFEEYLCPQCSNDVTVSPKTEEGRCPHCGTDFTVNRDAEFDNGRWIDLTRLSIKGQ